MNKTYHFLLKFFKSKSFLLVGLMAISLIYGMSCRSKQQKERPNILFCIMDDASPHMGAYGYKWSKTPNFDRLAAEGLLFTNAYTPNAKCAPSRANILTGRNSWQLEEAGNHVANFPAKFKTFPEALRENGYLTARTGKGYAPGNPGKIDGDRRQLIGFPVKRHQIEPWTSGMSNTDYSSEFEFFLENKEEDKPWFFWYGAHEPHRKYEYGSGQASGKKLEDLDRVPGFWPDTDTVRNDMLDYALEIEYADWHLGQMIESLEKRGLMENTIIVMTSDHGMPFPRSKAQEYEYSNKVPLAIRWPEGIKNPGRTVRDMVSFIDFSPSFLELAGIPFGKSQMHSSPGKSLTDIFFSEKEGQVNPDRDVVLIGRERHDYGRPNNQGFPIRGIVSDDYLYLYNYDTTLWPAGNPEVGYLDCDASPTKTQILKMRRAGEDEYYWQLSFGKRSSNEEFFNVTNDPDCINNLAQEMSLNELKSSMKARMEKMLKEQEDPRMFGNGDIFNQYGFYNEKGWNYYERFMKGEFTIKDTPWVSPTDAESGPLD
jgi:N-sulfoglucosamine sulfohydrolase